MKKKLSPARYAAYWIVSSMAVCFALLCYLLFSRYQIEKSLRFDHSAELTREKIQNIFTQYVTTLISYRGLYEERSGIVVRDVFELYTSGSLQTIPGLYNAGFAQYIHRKTESTFVFNARREGYLYFAIHPPLADTTGLVGLYLTPSERQPTLSGFNFLSKVDLREKIFQARDNNCFVLSADSANPGLTTLLLPLYAPAREAVEDVFYARPSTQQQLLKFMDTLVVQSKIQSRKLQRLSVDTSSLVSRRKNFSGMVFFQLQLRHLLDSLIQQTATENRQVAMYYTLASGSAQSSQAMILHSPPPNNVESPKKTIVIPFAGSTLWLYCYPIGNTEPMPLIVILVCIAGLILCAALWWNIRAWGIRVNEAHSEGKL